MKPLKGLLRAWNAAELATKYSGSCDGMTVVLDKDGWLDRHRRGDLTVDSFVWIANDVRVIGQAAVAIGVQSQIARYRGRDCSGAFVCTLVAVRREGRWRIVNVQLGDRAF